MAGDGDCTQDIWAAEQPKRHNDGRQLLEGHNHGKHSTLQFCIYFCTRTPRGRKKKYIIKSIGKVVLAQSVLFEVTGQIGTN